MNVLIIAPWDHSGAGNALMQAVNGCTEHQARQVAFNESYLQYPVDIMRPSRKEVADLVEWCDVLNLHDAAFSLIPHYAPDRPTVFSFHGSQYRERWVFYNSWVRDHGGVATAFNLDLAMLGTAWLPRPVPDMTAMRNGHQRNGTLKVAHAPTNRIIKDTDTVLQVLELIDGVETVLIEHKSNAECLEIKSQCDVLVEEFQLGYGTNAIECWAMGMPVIGHAYPNILGYMQQELGELPIVSTPLEGLRDTIIRLRDDPAFFEQSIKQGRDYWQQYHEPSRVANQFAELCQIAIETFEMFGG